MSTAPTAPTTEEQDKKEFCYLSLRSALSTLDDEIYDRIQRALGPYGHKGDLESWRGLTKPQIFDALQALGNDPANPDKPVVCATWRGNVADAMLKYFACSEGKESCAPTTPSVRDEPIEGPAAASFTFKNKKDPEILKEFKAALQHCGTSLKSLRGLSKPQLVDIFSEEHYSQLVAPEDRPALAEAVTQYFKNTANRHVKFQAQQRALEEYEAELADSDGVPFMGGLIQYGDQHEPFRNRDADELLELSDVEILLGKLEIPMQLLRASIIEFVVTCLFAFFHIGIVRAAVAGDAKIPAILPIAGFHVVLIVVSIFCAGPGSGAHFNFLVSVGVFFTGHQTCIRTICYIVAQLLGAIIGSVAARAVTGWHDTTHLGLAACTVGNWNHGQAFIAEFFWSFMVLFLAFGIALEPKQMEIFGPVLAPIFLALGLGTIIYASGGIGQGAGAGPSFNWGMCFGPAVAMGHFESAHWVYPIAQLVAAMVHAVLFLGAPPHHATEGAFVPMLLREKRKQINRDLSQKDAAASASTSAGHHHHHDHHHHEGGGEGGKGGGGGGDNEKSVFANFSFRAQNALKLLVEKANASGVEMQKKNV